MTESATDAIVVRHLVKRYGQTTAVDGIDLTVRTGEVFALVGPNGAGKTTTVEILEGHRSRDAGEVQVLGFDPATGGRRYRERIGVVLQEAGMDEELTVDELVSMYASFYPQPRSVDEVIDLVGLAGKRDARSKSLSGGQRRRLDLALGLIGDPELIFLDEPTTGFDPQARRRAWQVVADLCGVGKTVLLTTHYMEEARRLADRVAVIAAGRIVAVGSPEELTDVRGGAARSIRFRLPAGVSTAELPALAGTVAVEDATVDVTTREPTRDLHRLTGWSLDRGILLDGLALESPSFEDTYLDLVTEAGAHNA